MDQNQFKSIPHRPRTVRTTFIKSRTPGIIQKVDLLKTNLQK